MKKKINILLLSILTGCSAQKNELCLVSLEKSLTPSLNYKIKQSKVINIKDSIKCFDWNSLLIESGYGSKESIKKYYNIDIPYNFNNSNLDSEAIIFFLKDNTAINHIKVKNGCKKGETCKAYDFLTLIKYNKEAIIAKKDAVFEVYIQEGKDNQGIYWRRENAVRIKK